MSETKDRAHEEVISRDGITFEGIREVVAPVKPPGRAEQRTHAARADVLEHIRIACQPGGPFHTGTECRDCARFVNWLPSADRSQVTVRCLWRESDRAVDLMAYASVIPVVSEQTSVGDAAVLARAAGLPFLVVAENGRFRGLLRVEDLPADGRIPVRDHMIRPTWRVSADAPLSEVVRVMQAHSTDIVPVLTDSEDSEILGVITRAALCDAGLAAAFDDEAGP
jgi:hypothetical protein